MDFHEHFTEQGKYILFVRSENSFCLLFCVLKGKTLVIQHDLASLSVHAQQKRCNERVSFCCFPPQVTVAVTTTSKCTFKIHYQMNYGQWCRSSTQ